CLDEILHEPWTRHPCISESDPCGDVFQFQILDERMVRVKPCRRSLQRLTLHLQPALLDPSPSLGPGHDIPPDPVECRGVRMPNARTDKTLPRRQVKVQSGVRLLSSPPVPELHGHIGLV